MMTRTTSEAYICLQANWMTDSSKKGCISSPRHIEYPHFQLVLFQVPIVFVLLLWTPSDEILQDWLLTGIGWLPCWDWSYTTGFAFVSEWANAQRVVLNKDKFHNINLIFLQELWRIQSWVGRGMLWSDCLFFVSLPTTQWLLSEIRISSSL